MAKHLTNKQIAVIHTAKARVGMTDEEYLGMLQSLGVGSSKELDQAGFDVAMERFKAAGFRKFHKSAKKSGMDKPPAKEKARLLDKVSALLADMELPWAYADALAQRMYRVRMVRWCGAEQLRGIITALVKKQEKIQKKEMENEIDDGQLEGGSGAEISG